MADDTGDVFPMPTQIPWDSRQEGTLVFLRHKTITTSDIEYGLRLNGNYFRDTLTFAMLDRLKSDQGVMVMVFTPAGAYMDVTMKHKIEHDQFYVELSKAATLQIFEKNGYVVGDDISCWCKYKPKPPFIPAELVTDDKICILIQKFIPNQQPGVQIPYYDQLDEEEADSDEERDTKDEEETESDDGPDRKNDDDEPDRKNDDDEPDTKKDD